MFGVICFDHALRRDFNLVLCDGNGTFDDSATVKQPVEPSQFYREAYTDWTVNLTLALTIFCPASTIC
jgi:hypothetical protein